MDTLKAIQVFVWIAHHTYKQYWTLFDTDQQPQNYPLNVTFKSNDVIALHQICLKAQGVAMLPTLVVRQHIAQHRLQQVFTGFFCTRPDIVFSVCFKATFTENHTRIYCFLD